MKPLGKAVVVLCALVAVPQVRAQGTASPAQGYAWGENIGWVNFAPTHGGVTVHEAGPNGYLSGHAWAENVGWIKVGDGTGPYAAPGSQTSTDWGVNMDADGNMSGYAWGENVGWINFNTTHSQVTMTPGSGEFDGYAWGENIGWLHLKSDSGLYGVIRIVLTGVPALTGWGVAALVVALAGLARVRVKRTRAAA